MDGKTQGSYEQLESLEETGTHQAGLTTMLEALSYTIDRISSEVIGKSLLIYSSF